MKTVIPLPEYSESQPLLSSLSSTTYTSLGPMIFSQHRQDCIPLLCMHFYGSTFYSECKLRVLQWSQDFLCFVWIVALQFLLLLLSLWPHWSNVTVFSFTDKRRTFKNSYYSHPQHT
jgi:hypothetical protein